MFRHGRRPAERAAAHHLQRGVLLGLALLQRPSAGLQLYLPGAFSADSAATEASPFCRAAVAASEGGWSQNVSLTGTAGQIYTLFKKTSDKNSLFASVL